MLFFVHTFDVDKRKRIIHERIDKSITMKTYPIIPSTKEIKKIVESKFNLFGIGNEKRDLVLLVRGDIEVEQTAYVSFFGCIHCGYMATGTAGFHKMEKNGPIGNGDKCKVVVCTHCEAEDQVYYFDAVWKGSRGKIVEGCKDSKITIMKI